MRTLCLTLLMVAVAAATHNPITIYTFPSPAYFTQNGEVRLGCDNPRNYDFQYWLHPTEGIISVSTGRYTLIKHPDTVALQIVNAQQSDEGGYKCVYMDAASRVDSHVIQTHFRLPAVILSPRNITLNLTVGDNLNLTCDAHNIENRQWVRETPPTNTEVPLTDSVDGRRVISSDFLLQFRGIQLEDSGNYNCLLVNDLGVNRIYAHINVFLPPLTSMNPDVLTVEDGAAAIISCHVTGVPLPDITWRDAENRIITTATEGISMLVEDLQDGSRYSTLTFSSVDSTFTGPYTCRADNYQGDHSSTAFLRLTGTPDPPTNLMLSLVNSTNIHVTWEAPNSDVTTYVVTWEVSNRTMGTDRTSTPVAPQGQGRNSYTIRGLDRLTTYSVFVHATNVDGTGMNSPAQTITTTATVPGVARDVIVVDVGPSSVRVEWSPSTLPLDDGGSPLTTVRLTFKEVEQRVWSEQEVVTDVEHGYAIVSGLQPQRTYQVSLQVGNGQGYSASVVSESFETPRPGFPGSPSHVVAMNYSSDSIVVCWRESAVGRPFTTYNVEITESQNTERSKVLRLNITSVRQVQGCEAGIKVPDLTPGTCYTFVVYVTNSQGVGQPSPVSDVACTVSCGEGALCSTAVILTNPAIAGVVVGSVVLIAALVALTTCLVVRRRKKMALKANMHRNNYYHTDSTGSYDSRRDSGQSYRSGSTTGLLPSPRGTDSSSCSPQTSESSNESPDTATTITSNTDPFDFSSMPNMRQHMPLPQPVLCPQGGAKMEYPQPGVINRSVSDKFPMYPILEDPPPYPHHVFPALAHPPHKGHLQRVQPPLTVRMPGHVSAEGDMVMTDNPNYEERAPVSYYVDHNMSEADSDNSSSLHMQIPTPHFGESYSQSGYSPDMQRRQQGKPSPTVTHGNGTAKHGGRDGAVRKSDAEDDDTEFIDNDAYITFTPKFRIMEGQKGQVFETVQVK